MLHKLEVKQLKSGIGSPVDLEVASGECVVIDGPSGSGKSRLLRALADLDDCNGSVTLNKQSRVSLPATEWRRDVGLLAAEPVWWDETVAAHFVPDEAQMAQLNLCSDLLNRPIKLLSSGERQRFALLRALAVKPKILLLDEPTSQLDRGNTLAVEQLLTDLLDRQEIGLVWVSHDPEQRGRLAARSVMLALAGGAND